MIQANSNYHIHTTHQFNMTDFLGVLSYAHTSRNLYQVYYFAWGWSFYPKPIRSCMNIIYSTVFITALIALGPETGLEPNHHGHTKHCKEHCEKNAWGGERNQTITKHAIAPYLELNHESTTIYHSTVSQQIVTEPQDCASIMWLTAP